MNGIDWLVLFAPLRGLIEAQAIVKGISNLLELSDDNWHGLSEGITKILAFQQSQVYISFNTILLSGQLGDHSAFFDVNLP